MEVHKLPQRRMYWEVKKDGTFPPQQIIDNIYQGAGLKIHLDACNFPQHTTKMNKLLNLLMQSTKFSKKALSSGDTICLDKSIVKSFHCGLKGKMKKIRKPRPTGNEFKNLSDARTNVVTQLELYEGRDICQKRSLSKSMVQLRQQSYT